MRPTLRFACLLFLACLCASGPLFAHDLGVARVTLYEVAPETFNLQVKLPENIAAESPIFPEGCTVTNQGSIALPEKNRRDLWQVDCHDSISGNIIFPWQRDGVSIRALWLDNTETGQYVHGNVLGATLAFEDLRVPSRSNLEAATAYVALGVEHILLGWDHLAFVLALCLIAAGFELVKLVTVFTIGHSITLALATLDWFRLPIPPVEACIALSVAFVAREVWIDDTRRVARSSLLILSFGLLHGLGFASALEESGIRDSELLVGLLSFNIGVELGQLLFVLVVVSIMWVSRLAPSLPSTRYPVAFALGTLGMFWLLDRVAIFGT